METFHTSILEITSGNFNYVYLSWTKAALTQLSRFASLWSRSSIHIAGLA